MNKISPSVLYNYLIPTTLTKRKTLREFIIFIFKKERKALIELNIIFCDDEYLLNLNQQFLHHNYYTDILSFPVSGPGKPLIAEIYISVDRVKDNAKNLDTRFNDELHRVIFHGILHFCGYKDKTRSEIRKMRTREDKYLKAYLSLPKKS